MSENKEESNGEEFEVEDELDSDEQVDETEFGEEEPDSDELVDEDLDDFVEDAEAEESVIDEDDDDEDDEEPAPKARKVSSDDDEEEDEEEEDVEADLDAILKDRMASADDDEDEEEEDRSSTVVKTSSVRAEDFVCETCFMLVNRSQFGSPKDPRCPMGDTECPSIQKIFG